MKEENHASEHRVLVFGGTTEGRRIAQLLAQRGVAVTLCVASEYGEAVVPRQERIQVCVGRLDALEIEALLTAEAPSCVIDATHPYAVQVSENILAACHATKTSHYRLLREEALAGGDAKRITVQSTKEAVDYCKNTTGRILLTTGSKELAAFTQIPDYAARIYPRILPSSLAIEQSLSLGFLAKNLICMQGPFTKELNLALLRQFQISVLVTKESGLTGGFPQKLEAAAELAIQSIVIGRPPQQEGTSFEELIAILEEKQILAPASKPGKGLRFPLFVSLEGKKILVFGGGKVASRRVAALLPFGCRVRVIAPEFEEGLQALGAEKRVELSADIWKPGSCRGDFVLAASNCRSVNRQIAEECRQKKIPVNVADSPAQCDFYFPALLREKGIVAGICSSEEGADHTKLKNTAAFLRESICRFAEGDSVNHAKTTHTGRQSGKQTCCGTDKACDGGDLTKSS